MIVDPYYGLSEDGRVHTYPIVDFFPHRMHAKCWCRPVQDEEVDSTGPQHMVHNAMVDAGVPIWQ